MAYDSVRKVMVLFGGKGTIWGPVLGAVLLFTFQEIVWARFIYLHQLIFGGISKPSFRAFSTISSKNSHILEYSILLPLSERNRATLVFALRK